MGLGSLTNSRNAGVIAFNVSKVLPPWIGYRLADLIARRLSNNPNLPMVQGIRLNQWALSECRLPPNELDRSVQAVLRNITRSFFDHFYYYHRPTRLQEKIKRNQVLKDILSWQAVGRGGLIVCGLHMCSFDLVYQAITLMGLKTIGLTLPQETEAIAWQHQLRRKGGSEIIPATLPNLRKVIRRLKDGEIVVTGIDRPMEGLKIRPRFFGRPAQLPVHYIQLAAAANVPIITMASYQMPDGGYEILASDVTHFQITRDHRSGLSDNAERILKLAEEFILKAPEQWTMFHPVWPDLVASLP